MKELSCVVQGYCDNVNEKIEALKVGIIDGAKTRDNTERILFKVQLEINNNNNDTDDKSFQNVVKKIMLHCHL